VRTWEHGRRCVCVCLRVRDIFSFPPLTFFLLFFRYELGQLGLGEYEQKLHDLVPTLKKKNSIKMNKKKNVNEEQKA
jgi:hypothetical protein